MHDRYRVMGPETKREKCGWPGDMPTRPSKVESVSGFALTPTLSPGSPGERGNLSRHAVAVGRSGVGNGDTLRRAGRHWAGSPQSDRSESFANNFAMPDGRAVHLEVVGKSSYLAGPRAFSPQRLGPTTTLEGSSAQGRFHPLRAIGPRSDPTTSRCTDGRVAVGIGACRRG